MADWGAVVSELERVDVAACDAIQLDDAVAAATGVRYNGFHLFPCFRQEPVRH